MAKTFEILDDSNKYRKNCPLGIDVVYAEDFYDTFKTKYPEKFVDDPGMCPDDDPDYDEMFEENKPHSIYEMEYKTQLKWAYKVLKANNAKPDHGDVIWIGGDQYRNQGIHFWDAKKDMIIPMATHICDYGHVPKRFAVGKGEGEFSPDHWDGISYYNNLQPYWSSKKNKWFYPLEDDDISSVSDYGTDSD